MTSKLRNVVTPQSQPQRGAQTHERSDATNLYPHIYFFILAIMDWDKDKIDEVALALLYINSWTEKHSGQRAWKSLDWDIGDRLHEKGLISDPKGKAKSVFLSEEGIAQAKERNRRTPLHQISLPLCGTAGQFRKITFFGGSSSSKGGSSLQSFSNSSKGQIAFGLSVTILFKYFCKSPRSISSCRSNHVSTAYIC